MQTILASTVILTKGSLSQIMKVLVILHILQILCHTLSHNLYPLKQHPHPIWVQTIENWQRSTTNSGFHSMEGSRQVLRVWIYSIQPIKRIIMYIQTRIQIYYCMHADSDMDPPPPAFPPCPFVPSSPEHALSKDFWYTDMDRSYAAESLSNASGSSVRNQAQARSWQQAVSLLLF